MVINRARIRMFFLCYAITLPVQYLGGYFTQMSVTTWYVGLNKSALTPPGAAFGIAWTLLYLLMSIAAERVYHRVGTLRSRALRWWLIQLLLGLEWCALFFGGQQVAFGFLIIVTNWLAVLITILLFARIDKRAAWLMVPLLVWLTFASYLNYFILTHN